jgi:hypothetical protein
MAFGDIGGAVTELVVTCKTESSGDVSIAKGDAVKLTGAYTVSNATDAEDAVFGQAMAAADANDQAIPVKVRGVCVLAYTGTAPVVDGATGVLASATDGKVKTPASGTGNGLVVKTDATAGEVHVLL